MMVPQAELRRAWHRKCVGGPPSIIIDPNLKFADFRWIKDLSHSFIESDLPHYFNGNFESLS